MLEPHYYHHFGKKHTRSKKKKKNKKNKPALVIDITESIEDALPVYLIKIFSQKYRYLAFIKLEDCHRFVASNGFVLLSDSCPEVEELNHPNERSYSDENKLFVRGLDRSGDNYVVKAYGISYIEALKVAVKEYNSYCLEGD